MAFTIPNEADAFTPAQSELDKVDFDILVAGFAGNGVVSGCVVSQRGAGANMSVDVTVGLCRVAGYWLYSGTATTNVAITTADATNPRFDLVCINYNATISVTAGTPSAAPVFPSIPANSIVLAAVYVPANDTAITTAQCIDKRVIILDAFDVRDDFNGGNTTNGLIGNSNWNRTLSASSTIAVTDGIVNHPGIIRINGGTTSGGYATLHWGATSSSGCILPSDVSRLQFVFKLNPLTNCTYKLGLFQDSANLTQGSAGTAGAWIELFPASSNNFRAYARESSTSSSPVTTGVVAGAGTWYVAELFRLQNGNFQVVINGVLRGTLSSNLPTTGLNIGVLSAVIGSTTAVLDVDFIGLALVPSVRY